ncbi:hypothetical protein [Micromonospora sp. NPDC023737]|uniref:hypothetical protein n=1 Tax=unclassified Micromonospora TaxID=2617518 RepID=UPI0033DEDE20
MSPNVRRGLYDLALFAGILALCYLALHLLGARPSGWWIVAPASVAIGMGLRTVHRERRYRGNS